MSITCRSLTHVLCLLLMHTTANAADTSQPLIVAHRGLLHHAPEDTLSNFRACLELRLGFEFDVRRTRDGELVCIHDETVDRTTNGTGKVTDLSLEEIRQLDAGSWFDSHFTGEVVPTVEEVLALVANYKHHNVLIAVDLKARDAEAEVVRLARKHKVLHRLLFIGRTISETAVRDQIRQTSNTAQSAALANTPLELPSALEETNADWVYVRFIPTGEQMDAVRASGKQAFIAGVTVAGHLPDNWQRAADSGIAAILTDHPLKLRTIFRRPAAVD